MTNRLGWVALVLMLGACTGAIDTGPTKSTGMDTPDDPKTDDPSNMTLPDGGTNTDDPTLDDPNVGFDPPPGTYTHSWYGDVGPLLIEQCGTCHQQGASGPFPMTYGEAYKWRALIKTSTSKEVRSMPPMPVKGDGSCQTFANARWLTDEEIGIIATWVDEGAPKGVPQEMPDSPAVLHITNPDAVIEMPAAYTPTSSASDEYRCFPVKSPYNTDMFLTSYDVIPGAPSIDHHMILYLEPTGNNNFATTEDAKDAAPGYPCDITIGGPKGQTALPLAVWAPGGGRIDFPAGTGVRIPAGRTMVIQMHYNLAKGPVSDRTKINIKAAAINSGVHEAMFFPLNDGNINAPPGETLYMDSPMALALPFPLSIYGVFPHMHTKGKTLRVEYKDTVNGINQCLVDVDRWDFRWQEGWWYPKPVTVQGNLLSAALNTTSLNIQCGFNTTSTNETTHFGENTADEMCLNFLFVNVSDELRNFLTLGGID